jgi:hypothetical protein
VTTDQYAYWEFTSRRVTMMTDASDQQRRGFLVRVPVTLQDDHTLTGPPALSIENVPEFDVKLTCNGTSLVVGASGLQSVNESTR